MKWALTQPTNEVHYWTMYEGEVPAEMKYNGRAQSFRLTSGDKRLFFVERTGFLQNKCLVRTEYGQIVGEVHPGKNMQSGVLIMDNNKFHYDMTITSLELASKKEKFVVSIEGDDISKLNAFELCALLFSTARVTMKQRAERQKLELV